MEYRVYETTYRGWRNGEAVAVRKCATLADAVNEAQALYDGLASGSAKKAKSTVYTAVKCEEALPDELALRYGSMPRDAYVTLWRSEPASEDSIAYYDGYELTEVEILVMLRQSRLLGESREGAAALDAAGRRSYAYKALDGLLPRAADFTKRSVKGLSLYGTMLELGSYFEGAYLKGARFDESVLSCCSFKGAALDAALFQSTDIKRCCFDGASLVYARFWNSDATYSTFRGTDMRGAELGDGDAYGFCLDCPAEDADGRGPFEGARFEGAFMRSVADTAVPQAGIGKVFKGIRYDDKTALPDGFEKEDGVYVPKSKKKTKEAKR